MLVFAALLGDSVPGTTSPVNPPVYQVQVDDTSNFSSPLVDVTLSAGELSWVTPNLVNGKHYWRVRAVNGLGYTGPWSASGNFTVLAP